MKEGKNKMKEGKNKMKRLTTATIVCATLLGGGYVFPVR